jgi:hypothetical protein
MAMPETRKVFFALGAQTWVTRGINEADVQLVTQASDIAASEPSSTRLSAIDFRRRVGLADWAKVEIDSTGVLFDGASIRGRNDYSTILEPHINVLTVGPNAETHSEEGGIYLSQDRFDGEKNKFESEGHRWPDPIAGKACENMTAAYGTDGSATVSRRYHGFFAKVLERQAPLLRLQITTKAKTVEIWVNFSSREECDDPDEVAKHPLCATAVGPKSAAIEGAVFLSLKLCAQIQLSEPKQPPGAAVDPAVAKIRPRRAPHVVEASNAHP